LHFRVLGVVDRPREALHELGRGVIGAEVDGAHLLVEQHRGLLARLG
jgi:hypothetical protein